MGNNLGIKCGTDASSETRRVDRDKDARAENVKRPSFIGWYRILRGHHHWAIFEAIRYSLWLFR